MKKDTGFWAQFLPHYLRAKAMHKEMEQRAATLRTLDFTAEAFQRAQAFLPKLRSGDRPSIAFVVFAPDARGYDPVVIDILFKNQREEFLDLVAHEFHHWYRARMAPDLTRDQDILWVIEQTQLEGIADLINIPAQMRKPAESLSASEKRYLDFYRKSPEILRTMDALLADMQEDPGNRRELGIKLKASVPLSGHPTGFHMAETIVAELGKDALISTVSNPFAFFALYHEAAKKKAGEAPLLSEKSLALLGSLEKRYKD